MTSVYSVPESLDPSQTGSLLDDNSSQRTDREGTIATEDSDFSDDDVINVLSDNETLVAEDDYDDDFEITDIKPSLAGGNTFHPSANGILGSGIKPDVYLQQPVDQKPETTPSTNTRTNHATKGRMTEAQSAQIVALHEAGWSKVRIGAHIDRSPNTIQSFLRRRRIKINTLISTLPGSDIPMSRPPQRRRPQQQETAAHTRATQPTDTSAVRAAIRRDLFGLQDESAFRDVKPRFKKVEPL